VKPFRGIVQGERKWRVNNAKGKTLDIMMSRDAAELNFERRRDRAEFWKNWTAKKRRDAGGPNIP
jgi:hypothetical protein